MPTSVLSSAINVRVTVVLAHGTILSSWEQPPAPPGFARRLVSDMCSENVEDYPNVDGIVAVTHTEGGESQTPNNIDMLLRTLAGFTVHPNIGAMLLVDYGTESVTNEMLKAYMLREGYALDDVVHQFYRLQGSFDTDLAGGAEIIDGWLDSVNSVPRTEQSLENLKIALQCGGSDAFSGVSGNPLAAYVAKEVIRYGGCANLAETDELIGSEAYVLQNVRDLSTARTFLDTIERFKERVAWHGHSAEGNPSGGNNFRGLYNIAIKSIGAAMKRHPDVCLDYVINYSERMEKPGYYFMDSPRQRFREHRRTGRIRFQHDFLCDRQRIHHEFSVRADN